MYGCTSVENDEMEESVVNDNTSTEQIEEEGDDETFERSEYQEISPEDAYEKLQEDSEILLMDVRTEEEYKAGHIENAELLPLDVVADKAQALYPEKNQTIYVYCRSGRRSEVAFNILLDLGYQEVYDLGGIIDWPYEIVK